MDSEPEKLEAITELKLPKYNTRKALSPEKIGAASPIAASVPFRWEEEPGKPKPCTDLSLVSIAEDFAPKFLELPPRLAAMDAKISKEHSPTTVLDGPYIGRSWRFQSLRSGKHSSAAAELLDGPQIDRSSSRFQSCRMAKHSELDGPHISGVSLFQSFRMRGERRYDSTGNSSPEAAPFGAVIVSKKGQQQKEKALLGFWKRTSKDKRETVGGNYVFPSSADKENDYGPEADDVRRSAAAKITAIRKSASSPSLSQSKAQFWASVYEGLKQAVPWRSRRVNKGL